MRKAVLSAAVSAALAATASLAIAQSADVPADDATIVAQATAPRTGEAPRMQRQGPAQEKFRLPSERVEARIAYAKTALKITDAQQPQWENFANVLRKQARDMDQRFQQFRETREAARAQGAQPQRVSAIERLERRQQRMTERSQRLNEVIAAAKPLYAALSPEQKQIADDMLSQNRRGGGHRHHHQQHRGMHRGA